MATSAGTIPINATFNGAQLEKDVLSALNRIQNKSTLNLNTRNFTQPLGKITGLANEFNKSLEASNARVVAFGASAGLIFAVQKSFTALVASTIEVEKSLTDINIVLNTSSKGIKQFGDQLFDVARQTGAAFKDVAGAATEFSRQGLGLEETLKRTRDALILTRLSGLDVVSSTEALTAAVNSFTKEALTTTDVVNKLAAVDAKFAVSSRDLSEALQRVGSSASEAGVSFDELLGIVTSVQQTTARGGAVIGNALKTIFTRIERPQVIRDLKDFGITVSDISGNALPTIKVIENLAQSFQNLNPVVKSQVAELVGGVYQINILKAALADVSKQNSAFAEATRTSSQAADEAILKNKALNESLSALINETTVNFTQFASKIGDASIAPGIRKVLSNIINPALESFNNQKIEGVGAKIATGLLTGLTDFITGPGLGLGALAIGKLIANFTGFAGDAAKNILGIGRDQAVIQGEISKILSSNPQLIQQIIAGSKSRLQVEKEIKQILIEQAAISKSIKDNSKNITERFFSSGLTVSPETGLIGGRRSAGGYIPAKQQASEMIGAMQGGYAPGKVVSAPKSIGGVMNTAESVKYIPGFAQPYILPPQGSRAARDLTSKSMAKNGINPYQAKGFVPNFAPRSLDNKGRYADSDWWYGSELKASVPLSEIQTGTAASWSAEKGFFRSDGKDFTANDLNIFIRRGATYGAIRNSLPDSFFQDDPRYKAGTPIEQLRREFRPGSKTSTVESVKEEVRRIFEPFTPPASMLIWDLARKDADQDELVDLEKLTKDKKQAGRSYKIKIRALSGNALNEERFGLVDQTSKFARSITKKLALGIPGAKSDYSDAEVDDYFNKTGKNYSVLAGTIFEAGTNLAASYVRDRAFKGSMGRSGGGGDFDVMGGQNLSNVKKFFPGFTDSYGDYKLNNSYDSMREFIAKVEKEFPIEISNHFAKQESKIAGITMSSKGFIPNFAPEQLSFDFLASNQLSTSRPTAPMPIPVNEPITIGEKSGSSLFINPDGTLKVVFLRSSEGNPLFSIIKGLKRGLIKKIDAGAIIGPRVPNLITGLKNVLPDLRKNSPLIPASIPIKGYFNPKDLSGSLFRQRGEIMPSFDDGSLEQLNKYLNQKGYGAKKENQRDYSIFSLKDKVTTSFLSDDGQVYIPSYFSISSGIINELKKIPELNLKFKKKRETGSSNYNREDFSKLRKAFEEMGVLGTSPEGKSVWQNLSDSGYGSYVSLEDIYPNGLSKGFIPNFAPDSTGGLSLSTIRFLMKAGSKMSGSVLNSRTVLKFATGNGKVEDIIEPFLNFLKKPVEFISSEQDLNDGKLLVKTVLGNKNAREIVASKLAPLLNEISFSTQTQERSITKGIDTPTSDFKKDYESFLRYKMLGGAKDYREYADNDDAMRYFGPELIKNKDGSYRFNPKNARTTRQLKQINDSAGALFANRDIYFDALYGYPRSLNEEYGARKLGPEENIPGSNPFLGYTFKLGRFIGNLGKNRKAVRYEDRWDADLHGIEKEILRRYFENPDQKQSVREMMANSSIHKEFKEGAYAGDINSYILRELLSSIPNANPVVLKGISRIPKDRRFANGFVPNFNPVKEAMEREMAAGYTSPQVKVGQSSKLRTSFNPMGLGVFNSTEGSLNNGISLAEKAGINPKTKGMSAKGHIPNFAAPSGFDLFAMTAAFSALIFSIKQTSDSLKQLGLTNQSLKKDYASAAASYAQQMGQIPKDLRKKEKDIADEIQNTFTNVNKKTLKLTGTSVAPLAYGAFTTDPLTRQMTRSIVAATPEQEARLQQLRDQLAQERKDAAEKLKAARKSMQEAGAAARAADAPYFGKGMFAQNSKLSGLLKAVGPGSAIAASTALSVASQFVPEKDKQSKAIISGVSDVAQYAGTGAIFGAPGAVIGAIVGAGFAFKRIADAKAEEAIDKINESLDKTKEKSAEFSGAAQNYSSSLESLQNALNDPKSRPDALIRFQNNLTEALNSIPEEFKDKVLKAGTDITKVAEAIAGVNKELGNTQKNLEKQLAITQIIKGESSIFGPASVSPKNQKTLNALFASSVNPESITKNFGGTSGAADFESFINSLKSQAFYTRDLSGMSGGMAPAQKIGTEQAVNKEAAEQIKSELKSRGILTEDIANQLDQAFTSLKPEALESIIDALKKQGLSIIDNSKRSKILSEILEENTKRIRKNEEALKDLSNVYNDINLQISSQIDIEKNRSKTIREINKIQAEGAVSIQRARVKGLLDVSSQFIGEGTKNDIQNQLDVNEIITRQNSKVQDATNSLLDSFTETLVKKSEEARSKVEAAVLDPTREANDIQKERMRFQQTIQQLNPLITQSLKDINAGGNVGDIKNTLEQQIRAFSAFKPEERDVIIQSLDTSFEDFKNKLAEIKAQGDIDLKIQEAQREYQKQSLALNQRLSFAGGAQALSSTGKAGVSDLFDNISELISELRQTNTIGNAAQRGSSAFKLLNVLTNQLQLNRAVDDRSFNAQVSSDLNPLAATAIAGRVQQIRESVDLARRVTEIQTGKSTAGSALGRAFDQAKEGAVQTALDQIASQFKLENMGSYLDVLQQEARFLNDLTKDQNEILAKTLPTTLNANFQNVITQQVGNKLDTLTSSLTEVINKLSTASQKNILETQISNTLPADLTPEKRKQLLEKILSTDLKDVGKSSIESNATGVPYQAYFARIPNLAGNEEQKEEMIKKLNDYFESFNLLKVLYGGAQFDEYGNIESGVQYNPQQYKNRRDTPLEKLKEAISLQEQFGSSDEDIQRNYETLQELTQTAVGRVVFDPAGTFEEFVKKQSNEFGTSQLTVQQVKDIQSFNARIQGLGSAPALMSQKKFPLQELIDQYDLLGSVQNSNYKPREVDSDLANARKNLQRVNALFFNRFETNKDLMDLNEKINNLLKQDSVDTQKREELIKLQTELRAKTLEQEKKIAQESFDLYYKSGFGKTFFKDEKAAQANALIESEARQGRVAVGAITQKNTEYNRADFARDTGQLIDTFQTDFKSGIASAFGEAIKGTKTLKDAFRDMFQNILNRMLDKSLEMGVDALFAFGKAYYQSRKDGGLIRGYNSGGMVVGGSGMKDDVPAMMSGGEYVIKKSSVNKYGANYLRALNGGVVPRYATGGFSIGPLQNEFLYDNPDRPTSGEYAVDSRLSAMALTDENNPQNKLREDRFNKLDQYLQDRDQFEREKKQAIKNYKNQVSSTFYSGLISAGVQLGAAGLTVGAGKLRANATTSAARGLEPGGANLSQAQLNAQYAKYGRANGGYIARFAGGGSTGKDNIPALLMGGEYVMNKKAVDMYGKDFMGQLNSGTLPKYASGGMVGTSYTGENNPQTSVEELVTALNTLNENLSKDTGITQAESGKASIAGATQESGMSVVNNISINVAQGGEVTSDVNSNAQGNPKLKQNNQNSVQDNAKLAELLRNKVVEVLVEQKRPGGLLYASR